MNYQYIGKEEKKLNPIRAGKYFNHYCDESTSFINKT